MINDKKFKPKEFYSKLFFDNNDLKKMFRVIGRNLRLVKNSIFPLTESLKFDIKVSDITRDHDSKMEIKKQLGTWTINIENKSKIQIIAFN